MSWLASAPPEWSPDDEEVEVFGDVDVGDTVVVYVENNEIKLKPES